MVIFATQVLKGYHKGMNNLLIFMAVVIVVFIVWSALGYFSSRVEQAEYVVVQKSNDYEIRNYSPHIVAETTIEGPYSKSLNEGFQIIARYIFGGNSKNQKVAMTAPVVGQKQVSEKIAMTAPVVAAKQGESHIVSFGMPRSYTLETLPTPLDTRIRLVEVPPKKMAVMKFSGSRTDARVKKIETRLLLALSKDSVEIVGEPAYAGYNAPWTPPWMTRNEVMVEVKN